MIMTIAVFVCMTLVAVIMSGFFVVLKSSTDVLHFTFKLLAPLSCLLLALVSANLSSSFGGYTIFIAIGLALVIGEEAFKCVKNENQDKAYTLFTGIINLISLICFVMAGILLTQFTPWGMFAGLCLGLCASFIIMIFKRMSILNWSMTAANIAAAGALFGQTIALLVAHANLVTSIIYFVGSFIALFQIIFSLFTKDDRTLKIISNVAQMLSLTLLAASIFFLV